MRFIILFLGIIFAPCALLAVEPLTACPSGYVTVEKTGVDIYDTCPSGTISIWIEDMSSCLATSNKSRACFMYAPAEQDFSDISGTYEFSAPCQLK